MSNNLEVGLCTVYESFTLNFFRSCWPCMWHFA